jgi:hypothetical protein
MTITLNLNAELQARLAREARARGMALETYVQALIELAGDQQHPSGAGIEEFRATLNALAEGAPQLPPLRSDSFRRESIYQDHD